MKPLHIVKIVRNTRVLTKLPFLPHCPLEEGNKVGKSFIWSESETVITSPEYVLAYNCSFIRYVWSSICVDSFRFAQETWEKFYLFQIGASYFICKILAVLHNSDCIFMDGFIYCI